MSSPWSDIDEVRDADHAWDVLDALEEASEPPPADALERLSRLSRWLLDEPTLLAGWPDVVDELAMASVCREPSLLAHASGPIRDLLAIRLGQPARDPEALARALAEAVATGTLSSTWTQADGGALARRRLRHDRRLTEETHRWFDHHLPDWPHHLARALSHTAGAPLDDLALVLPDLSEPRLCFALAAAPALPDPGPPTLEALRRWSPEAMARLAEQLVDRPDQAERCAILALTADPGLDLEAHLSGAAVHDPDTGVWWPMIASVLDRLPRPRREAIARRALATDHASAFLFLTDHPELVGHTLRRLSQPLSPRATRMAVIGLSRLGPDRVDWLVHAWDRAPDPRTRALVGRAILGLLHDTTGTVPDGADHTLDLDAVPDPDRALRELDALCERMEAARADAVIAELLGTHRTRFADAFALLGHGGPMARRAALDAVVWEAHRITPEDLEHLASGLERLSDPIPFVDEALSATTRPEHSATLIAALARTSLPQQVVERHLPAAPVERVQLLAMACRLRLHDDASVPAWLAASTGPLDLTSVPGDLGHVRLLWKEDHAEAVEAEDGVAPTRVDLPLHIFDPSDGHGLSQALHAALATVPVVLRPRDGVLGDLLGDDGARVPIRGSS